MSLKFSTLKNIASRFVGNASTETALSQALIVNTAGRTLYQLASWSFRKRTPITLSFTSGENEIELPLDMGPVISTRLQGLTKDFTYVSEEKLAQLEDDDYLPVGFTWFGCILRPHPASLLSPFPAPVLRVYPTPSSDLADQLQIYYRADWPELTDDDHYAQIPPYCEGLLITIVQMFSNGWIEDFSERAQDYLSKLLEHPQFQLARKEDIIQHRLGVIRGGAVQAQLARGGLDYLDARPYTNPS